MVIVKCWNLGSKFIEKSDAYKLIKIDAKSDFYNYSKWWVKNHQKSTQNWPLIKWSKIAKKLICHGGVKKW
jgi:hypothetical protein